MDGGEMRVYDYLYEERAAIKEFMGGMTREQAEREARAEHGVQSEIAWTATR